MPHLHSEGLQGPLALRGRLRVLGVHARRALLLRQGRRRGLHGHLLYGLARPHGHALLQHERVLHLHLHLLQLQQVLLLLLLRGVLRAGSSARGGAAVGGAAAGRQGRGPHSTGRGRCHGLRASRGGALTICAALAAAMGRG